VVCERILDAARDGGRWEHIGIGEGRQARVWAVDLGGGMEAWVSTRFSGLPDTPGSTAFVPATLLQRTPPFADDTLIELWVSHSARSCRWLTATARFAWWASRPDLGRVDLAFLCGTGPRPSSASSPRASGRARGRDFLERPADESGSE
jgi:hypothetical protein